MNRFKKILKWTLIALATPIVLVYGINLFDVPLDPANDSFKPSYPADLTEQNNGYYYLMGLKAASGENPYKMGQRFVQAYNAARRKGYSQSESPAEDIEQNIFGYKEVHYTGKNVGFCDLKTQHCIPAYLKSRKTIEKSLRDNRLLIERTSRLLKYNHYAETVLPGMDSPLALYPGSLNNLLLAKSALDAEDGRLSEALSALDRNNRFWRVVLKETTTLIGKLVAVSYLDRNISLVSEMMSRYSMSPAQLAMVKRMVAPLSDQELNMDNVFKNEFQFIQSVLTDARRDDWANAFSPQGAKSPVVDFLLKPLFQYNATLNDAREIYLHYQTLGEFSSPEFLDYIKTKARPYELEHSDLHAHFIYNPIGKTLNAISSLDFTFLGYIGRVHNLDAKLRLVTIQHQIKRLHIPGDRVEAFLNKSPDSLRNPYTGNAASWNADQASIGFEALPGKDSELRASPLSGHIQVRI